MSTATHGGKRGKKEGTEILDKLRIVMVTVLGWRATHRLIAVPPYTKRGRAKEEREREREQGGKKTGQSKRRGESCERDPEQVRTLRHSSRGAGPEKHTP